MRQRRFSSYTSLTLLVLWHIVVLPGCSCTPRPDVARSTGNSPSTKQSNNPAVNDRPAANPTPPSDSTKSSRVSQPQSADPGPGRSANSRTGIAGIASGAQDDVASPIGQEAVSPADAFRQGTRLYDAALELERQRNTTEAFAKARCGWQLVRSHPDDPQCARLERQLLPLVERLGDAANAKFQGGSPIRTVGKPTVIE